MSREINELSAVTTLNSGDLLHLQSLVTATWRDRKITVANAFATLQPHRTELDRACLQGSAFVANGIMDISGGTGDFAYVTGNATITRLGTATAGTPRTLRFQGLCSLTHSATYLVLPGGRSLDLTPGDICTFRSLGSNCWLLIGLLRDDLGTFLSLNGNLSDVPDKSAARGYLNAQLASYVLDIYTGIEPSADVQTLLGSADLSTFLSTLGARKQWVTAPIAFDSDGVAGDEAYDADFHYVCIATNTWKRSALATF